VAIILLGLCALLMAACTNTNDGVTSSMAGEQQSIFDVFGQPAPHGASQLLGVTCPTVDRCWAVGTGPPVLIPTAGPAPAVIVTTDDGGISWSTQTAVLSGPSTLSAISCASGTRCMAVGDTEAPQLAGAVAVTDNAGRTWQQMDAPVDAVDLVGVQCRASICMVLATDGSNYWTATTNDGGMVWQRGGDLPTGFAGAGALVCPTPLSCLVAGYVPTGTGHAAGSIAHTSDGGGLWAPAAVPFGTGLLHDLSCPSVLLCLAVGTEATTISALTIGKGAILVSRDGGDDFSSVPAPPGIDDAFGVSCPSVLSCVAVGTVWTPTFPSTPLPSVVTTTNFTRTWKVPTASFVPAGLAGVACPSPTMCLAVGGDVVARMALPAVTLPTLPSTSTVPRDRGIPGR
jgi:photosystem II stability/assembly factor-like uncharacterized protein